MMGWKGEVLVDFVISSDSCGVSSIKFDQLIGAEPGKDPEKIGGVLPIIECQGDGRQQLCKQQTLIEIGMRLAGVID